MKVPLLTKAAEKGESNSVMLTAMLREHCQGNQPKPEVNAQSHSVEVD